MQHKDFKGQYFLKEPQKIKPFREMPLSKLVRYYMRKGCYLKSYAACLKALQELFFILSQNPTLHTFERLGGYSPLAGEFLQSRRFYNPQLLIE